LNSDGYTNLEEYLNSLVPSLDTTAPAMTAGGLAGGLLPMSLQMELSESVAATLSNSDLVLLNQTTNQPVASGSIALSYAGATNIATFTFPGLTDAMLADGNYRATLPFASVNDVAGNLMNADATVDFFVFAGDANHDRRVDTTDFNVLAGNFGQSNRTVEQGNFNYAGAVDSIDFGILLSRYGKTLPAPVAVSTMAVASGATTSIFGITLIASHSDWKDLI
jgi:hypothetical protein